MNGPLTPHTVAVSMFEIEYLVEYSVGVLAACGADPWELRSQYWNLYEFEGRWDTSFTHFRNMDELLTARFVYRVPLTEHPDHERCREYFDELSGFAFLHLPDGTEDGGYTEPPHLYFDAGSLLWERMVQLGRLTGLDAEWPREVPLAEVGLRVATLAEQQDDRELIARWYRLLAIELDFDDDPSQLARDPTIAALRAMVRRTDAMSLPLHGVMLADPDPQTLAEFPLLKWWFTPTDD
jgi:hypothetical protein